MPNPAGDTFLQANQNYVWQDGDVYLIPQTDTSEGAGPGASFGGLGSDNQPHQLLLNKLNYLKKQNAQFTSSVGQNGWYQLSDTDINLGPISPLIQWGRFVQAGPILLAGGGPNQVFGATFTLTYPKAFTTAIWHLTMSFALNPNPPGQSFNPKFPFVGADVFGGADSHFNIIWPPGLTSATLQLIGEDWDTYYGTFYWNAVGY